MSIGLISRTATFLPVVWWVVGSFVLDCDMDLAITTRDYATSSAAPVDFLQRSLETSDPPDYLPLGNAFTAREWYRIVSP